ncbi:EamA family transporter [Pseudodesulfovibrio sp.]|uniref:EamA family transporter n=1 Tax=unclassified Pseudodesulfovibrio TaxID=2661612 RepID=UPI003B00CE13
MIWLTLSLGAAFFMASGAAYMKRFFSDVSPWEMGLIPAFYASPFCLLALFFVDIPKLGPNFFPIIFWLTPLFAVSFLLHYRAVGLSPLSLTMPFLSFTPVFVILTGNLLLHEHIGTGGVIGILLVVAGGYVLNLDSVRDGVLGPIRAIFREPGSALMLLVAAIYSLTSVGGKMLILQSSPLFAALIIFGALGPLLGAVLWMLGKVDMRIVFRRPLLGLGAGLIVFGDVICHNLAISMINAAYMVALKRMAGIFSVIFGRVLFNEKGILFRLIGTAIMTIGAAVIVIWG